MPARAPLVSLLRQVDAASRLPSLVHAGGELDDAADEVDTEGTRCRCCWAAAHLSPVRLMWAVIDPHQLVPIGVGGEQREEVGVLAAGGGGGRRGCRRRTTARRWVGSRWREAVDRTPWSRPRAAATEGALRPRAAATAGACRPSRPRSAASVGARRPRATTGAPARARGCCVCGCVLWGGERISDKVEREDEKMCGCVLCTERARG